MHVQPIDLKRDTVVCPDCGVLQNVEVEQHDEEVDLMAGQRCWYCGGQLLAEQLLGDNTAREAEFRLVISSLDVPYEKDAITAWANQLSRDFGGHLKDFDFDSAGRCLVTLKPTHTGADLDLAVD